MKTTELNPYFPNYNSIIYKTYFAGNNVYGRSHRHDSICFLHDEVEQFGLIEALLSPKVTSLKIKRKFRAGIVGLLIQVEPVQYNRAVVDSCGHLRYSYNVSTNDFVETLLVDGYSILRPSLFVVDPYWVKCRYGQLIRVKHVPDNTDTQRHMRYLNAKSFNIYARSKATGRKR